MSETAVQAPTWRIETWFPEIDSKIQQKLKLFSDEIARHNRALDLVSAKTLPFADAIHFADCINGSRLINKDQPKMTELYDISGNGLPGIVYGLLFPHVKVVLPDINDKKIEFLKGIAALCHMTNIDVQKIAIDKLPPNAMKFAVARGFATISKTILVSRKLMAVGGDFYHMKGETWPAEVGEIPTQLCSAWTPALVGEYKLPVGAVKFAVVKTTRIGS